MNAPKTPRINAEIRAYLQDYHNGWKCFYDNNGQNCDCTLKELKACFDKFIWLYIAYNTFYSEIPYTKKHCDNKKATDDVSEYFTADKLLESLHLNEEPNSKHLRTIITMLKDSSFHIVCEHGQTSCKKDNELAEKLEGKNTNDKAKALLKVFYQIRCNLFHGRKDITHQKQKELFDAVNPLLEQVVDCIYKELDKEAKEANG